MDDKLKYFLILQCLLGLAWSKYLSYDETYESLIGSSELSGPPWSDPYNSEDVEDYYDYAAYDDFERPYLSGNDDSYDYFGDYDDGDGDDYPSYPEEEYVLHPSGGFPQKGIVAFDNDYAYDSDDDLQYDEDRRGKNWGQTFSGDDDGIPYINGEVPYSDED